MPEIIFTVRWPDQTQTECYSPSTIVKDYFLAGQSYPLAEFVALSRTALNSASERVRARHGHSCSLALGQLTQIERYAQQFNDFGNALVVIEKIDPRFS